MKRESHLGVYALIHEKGRVALILKSRGPYIGCWDLPGGRIEFGETPAQALAREVHEEVGLRLLSATPLDNLSTCVSFENENGEATKLHHIGIIYACGVETPEELHQSGDDQDAGEARWVPIDEAEGLGLTPFARILIARVADESRDES